MCISLECTSAAHCVLNPFCKTCKMHLVHFLGSHSKQLRTVLCTFGQAHHACLFVEGAMKLKECLYGPY